MKVIAESAIVIADSVLSEIRSRSWRNQWSSSSGICDHDQCGICGHVAPEYAKNTKEIRNSYILALFEDREGNLWIGTKG
ncbi:MAG: hypothetical protein H0W76_23860, partial [Pyrinomonadaceae bacterium]|nr:hypothetical protein [Pyrinomonadaceae bacterium]